MIDDLHEIASSNSDNGDDYNGSDGNDDDDRGGRRNDSGGAEGNEQATEHEHLSSNDDLSDDHSRNIDAINEFELAEGLRLSALEASAAGYSLGSDNERSGTDDEDGD